MADLSKLRALMRTLRDTERGCPWDLAQDFHSIVPHTLEEAYEVADAIESDDFTALPAELGDLLFQIAFYCQLGEEDNRFSFDDVVEAIEHKLTVRHPHVFGGAEVADLEEVATAWEARKAQERHRRGPGSELDDVPLALPALSRAGKVQKRAARVGFDWPDDVGAWSKLEEEVSELRAAQADKLGRDAIHEELGDVLFAVVNVARHLGIEPESSLRHATSKFERRFRGVEQHLSERAIKMAAASPELLDELWNTVKREQKKTGAGAPVKDQEEERGRN